MVPIIEPNLHEIAITLTGYIVNCTQYGDAFIQFSKEMDNIGVELSHINESLLDIYIVPYDNYTDDIDDFNMSKLNLTWEAMEFYQDYLRIKIKFESAPWISQNKKGRDWLMIHIRNAEVNLVRYRR